jgi:hypothetical protein
MNTNKSKLLLLKNEVFQVVGCAIEVLNTLGHGLLEKAYENALVVEFGLREGSFSAATAVRRRLQRAEDWSVRTGPDCV